MSVAPRVQQDAERDETVADDVRKANIVGRHEAERLRDSGVAAARTPVFAELIADCARMHEADEDAIMRAWDVSREHARMLVEHPWRYVLRAAAQERRGGYEPPSPRPPETRYDRLVMDFRMARGSFWNFGST